MTPTDTGVSEELRNITALEVWNYNECPWNFDNPPEGMAQLQKQISLDQADRILATIAPRLKAEGLREAISLRSDVSPHIVYVKDIQARLDVLSPEAKETK